MVPATISAVVLPRLTSRAAARLYLTGEVFDADQAAAVGLVSAAVPATQLDAAVARACEELLRGAPAALAATKRLLRRGTGWTREEPRIGEESWIHEESPIRVELAELSLISAEFFHSDDAREGIAAFREKRAPRWELDDRG